MSKTNLPYRITLQSSLPPYGTTLAEDNTQYQWCLEHIGYGGIGKKGVDILVKNLENDGFVFDKNAELWSVKAERKMSYYKKRFYFHSKESLFWFKLTFGGLEE